MDSIYIQSIEERCRLFIAGHDVALRVGEKVFREVLPKLGIQLKLRWLVSAGIYWSGSRFNMSEHERKFFTTVVDEVFVDSGAQQFFTKFRGFNYPYTPRAYVEFAIGVNARYIATLDLPLDILTPRGLPVQEGIEKTVELGVKVIDEYEKLMLENTHNDPPIVVPVLQGYNSPSQWLECLDLYKQHGICPSRYRYWGLGSICMMRSPRLVKSIVEAVRKELGTEIKLHVFGISLNALRQVIHLIDSYDTAAWVYWAKMDGAVLVWDPTNKRFVHLQVRHNYEYPTITLMQLNLMQLVLMHLTLNRELNENQQFKA